MDSLNGTGREGHSAWRGTVNASCPNTPHVHTNHAKRHSTMVGREEPMAWDGDLRTANTGARYFLRAVAASHLGGGFFTFGAVT